jgi:hypothetical protein
MRTGYVFQEEESNGVPAEQGTGKIEGGRCNGDAGANRTSCAWAETMKVARSVYYCTEHMGRRSGSGMKNYSPQSLVSVHQSQRLQVEQNLILGSHGINAEVLAQ